MKSNQGILGPETLLPVGAVLTSAGTIVGFVIWLTTIHYTANAASQDNNEILRQLREINTRLSRIEGRLDKTKED